MVTVSSTVTEWGDILRNSTNEFATRVGNFLPTAIGALILFVLGLVVASAFRSITRRLLKMRGVANLIDNKKVHEGLKKAGVEWSVADMIASIVYWIVVLIFLMSVTNVLGLTVLADTLQRTVAYVPNVVAAVIAVAVAIAASRVIRDLVIAGLTTLNASFTKLIGGVVEAIVVIFGIVMAISQLGFDTSILTANITVIIAGIVATLALAFGLGTRDLVKSISVKHYTNKTFKKGQKLSIGDHTGTIKDITDLGVILNTKDGDVFISNNQLV